MLLKPHRCSWCALAPSPCRGWPNLIQSTPPLPRTHRANDRDLSEDIDKGSRSYRLEEATGAWWWDRQNAISKVERQTTHEPKTVPTRREVRDWEAMEMASTDQRSLRCLSGRKPGFRELMFHENFTGLVVQEREPGLHAHWPRSTSCHGRLNAECSLSHEPSSCLQHAPLGLYFNGENKASSPQLAFDSHCRTIAQINEPLC